MSDRTIESLIEDVKARWFGRDEDTWVALGLAGEAGELCNLIKKESRVTAPAPRYLQSSVAEECVDVLFYLLALVGRRGIDLGAAWDAKMLHNDQKYGRALRQGQG